MAKGKREKARIKGIFKRGNVYWICYKNLAGRIIRESSKSEKYAEAVDKLSDRRQEIKKGEEPEVKKIPNHTFNELAEEYLAWAERQRSYERKKGFIGQLKEEFGHLPLRRFNTLLIEQFQTGRLNNGKRFNRGNKPATVNRLLATLKHMFTKAVDWNMVEEGILKRIRKVKLLPENNRRLRYLSKEEIQNLLGECDGHLKPIVVMALNTGCRKSEILNLRWDQVDLKQGFILLDDTKNGERREIPINGTLREILESHFVGTKERPRRLDIPWVFYDAKTGKPYKDVKRSFTTACRKAGIKDFVPHDLRHVFASQLVMAGVDLTTVKELLGHKTLTMTLRYAHLAPSHKVKAVDLLDQTINHKIDEIQEEKNSTSHLLHNLA
ncbi:MAG: site-specific integrase [Deltaproteobacteria bacterium]|nr:site-specific integrase [Deltaproteobacteria bacterium]